jgi:hypothetical protein
MWLVLIVMASFLGVLLYFISPWVLLFTYGPIFIFTLVALTFLMFKKVDIDE